MLRSYGLPEKPDRTSKKVSVFGTGCFENQPILGATGPVIYGSVDVIWSTELYFIKLHERKNLLLNIEFLDKLTTKTLTNHRSWTIGTGKIDKRYI